MKLARILAIVPLVACSPIEKRQFGGLDVTGLLSGLAGLISGGSLNSAVENPSDVIGGLISGIDIEKVIASIDIDAILSGPLGNVANTVMNKVTTNPIIIKSIGNIMTAFMASQKAMKLEITAGQLRPGLSKKIKLVYGPYVLRAANESGMIGNSMSLDPKGTSYAYALGEDFPRDITILHSKTHMVDENFKPISTADGLYNHHNLFYDFSSMQPPAVACESKRFGLAGSLSAFAGGATGEEDTFYTSEDGKFNSGFYIGKDAPLMVVTDTVNNNNVRRTVYTETEFEYVEGKPEGAMAAMDQVIDLGMCGGQTGFYIRPPPGQKKFSMNSTGIIFARDGYVIRSKGHMHDGGVNVRAKLNGKEFCLSEVIYGGKSTVGESSNMAGLGGTTDCSNGFPVKKGDKLDLSAYYDLEAHPPRMQGHDHSAEEMALFVVTFGATNEEKQKNSL